ncbi:MAG TPA: glucose 1-dehydrogenase [Actinomycetota bacterium]|jgi:NAD(P)-dependent dehydrogenase (short-subunit alcohol dehydrogenase family)|nr:glucose 1-dehydrogenase [Actinomycetota bacterium]
MADRAGRLAGKVAIVTGGGSGIGRAAALRFAAEGAAVLVADVAGATAEAVAKEATAAGGRALGTAVDVTDRDQVTAMVERAVAEFGGVDVLMTAAGIIAFGDVTETDPDVWERVLAVNLTGAYLCARAVIPLMVARGGGSIVTISSSTGAHDAAPGTAAYIASKGGVAMLTKAMAVDHAAAGVRVNAIAPGPTATPMLQAVMSPDELRAFGQAMPIGRLADPAELAAAALFLASDDASYVTGAVFAVDGGQTAKVGMTLADLGTIDRRDRRSGGGTQ